MATEFPVIELRGAAFSYGGAPQLSDVTATVDRGDAVALVGPNGSGKSTLLKGILGLVDLAAGEIRVLGATPRAALPSVGYLSQLNEVDHEFPVSVSQVVMMGRYRSLGLLRWPSSPDKKLVRDALAKVGLTGHANRRFGELSGGQQQRALLARALSTQPQLLLLDEPFNGLDQDNRLALLDTLNTLRSEGVTIVTSTHDLQLARDVCTKVMLLNHTLIAYGPVEQTLRLRNVEKTFEHTIAHLDDHSVVSAEHENG